jgi:hypothetical protein
MSRSRRKFHRPLGDRRYRKLFVIAVEGAKTEPQYFNIFNDQNSVIRLKCLDSKHKSSARQVLKRMKDYIKQEGLRDSDEAWLVVDKDSNPDERLAQLFDWSTGKDNYGFALSNPMFEYWLLLHFEDGSGVSSGRDCSDRLKQYLPDYDKGIDVRKFTSQGIEDALRRARLRDLPPCVDWPQSVGTTVYRLIEAILKERHSEQ